MIAPWGHAKGGAPFASACAVISDANGAHGFHAARVGALLCLEAALRDCLVAAFFDSQHLKLVLRLWLDEFRRNRHERGCGRESNAKFQAISQPLDDDLVCRLLLEITTRK